MINLLVTSCSSFNVKSLATEAKKNTICHPGKWTYFEVCESGLLCLSLRYSAFSCSSDHAVY